MKTFKIGGVHPQENKLTAGSPIVAAPLPQQAVVMLSQHIGAPAQCVVEKGTPVKVGTLIAQANGFVSANIHSPVSGVVAKVDMAADSSGYMKPAIYINVMYTLINSKPYGFERHISATASLKIFEIASYSCRFSPCCDENLLFQNCFASEMQ